MNQLKSDFLEYKDGIYVFILIICTAVSLVLFITWITDIITEKTNKQDM